MDQSERFAMRVSPAFLSAIDEWRRHQPDIPPRAEAIRRLIEVGLLLSGARVIQGVSDVMSEAFSAEDAEDNADIAERLIGLAPEWAALIIRIERALKLHPALEPPPTVPPP